MTQDEQEQIEEQLESARAANDNLGTDDIILKEGDYTIRGWPVNVKKYLYKEAYTCEGKTTIGRRIYIRGEPV